jgi:hypothetical protein
MRSLPTPPVILSLPPRLSMMSSREPVDLLAAPCAEQFVVRIGPDNAVRQRQLIEDLQSFTFGSDCNVWATIIIQVADGERMKSAGGDLEINEFFREGTSPSLR